MSDRFSEAANAAPSGGSPNARRSRAAASSRSRVEPVWEILTKWSLLVVAVVLACVVGAELVRTLITLGQAPVAIVAGRVPPPPSRRRLVRRRPRHSPRRPRLAFATPRSAGCASC